MMIGSTIYFRRALGDVITKEKLKLAKQLQENLEETQSVSITMDLWSDRKMRGFIGLTVHHIDEKKAEFKSNILGIQRFHGE